MRFGLSKFEEMCLGTSKLLVESYNVLIQKYLQLNFEVGGLIDLSQDLDLAKYFGVTIEGNPGSPVLESYQVYPFVFNDNARLINWHTHP